MTPQATISPRSPAQRSALKLGYSPNINRGALRGDAAVAQMADDFRLFAASAGSVSEGDLEVLGWTPAQIALHGRHATRRAHARSAREREVAAAVGQSVARRDRRARTAVAALREA